METGFGLYWGNLIFSGMFWLGGFYVQKTSNSRKSGAYRFRSEHLWMWLLGLRPGKDYVYLGPAIFQTWALIALISGFIAVYFWGGPGFKMVLYTVYLGGLAVMSLIGWVIRIINQR